MKKVLVQSEIRKEEDVVFVRRRARDLAAQLGFDSQDQIRIATAVSEVARNAFQYAGNGKVEFAVERKPEHSMLTITVKDTGPGISHLQEVLGGNYQSRTGMGVGLIGAKRLMDQFEIESSLGKGTSITLKKIAPFPIVLDANTLQNISKYLIESARAHPIDELNLQNRDLVNALEALRAKQDELNQINRELEETNRGVVALYAELEEKASALREANSAKSRFLSNITHEFRSPLNAMTNLTSLLLNRADGDLTSGQEKQVQLIRKSLESLSVLVNDLLDLAKVEAGKVPVRVTDFSLNDMLGTLRGLFRNLITDSVNLRIDDVEHFPLLHTDEGKVAQILRNLVSNAIKYTPQGEVSLTAELKDRDTAVIHVRDTGIGISADKQQLVFEEFVQIESPLQIKHKGTGLGLSLSRRLAELLGGTITLRSSPGEGSTFSLTLPIRYSGPNEGSYVQSENRDRPTIQPKSSHLPIVLMIDDREEERYVLKSFLSSHFQCDVREAHSGGEGLALAQELRPALIFLDLVMPDLSGFEVYAKLRKEPSLVNSKIVVYSGNNFTSQERTCLPDLYEFLPKFDLGEEELLRRVKSICRDAGIAAT